MCLFCSIAQHKMGANIVFENKDIIAILDIEPISEGHVLLIPKEHYLDADDMPKDILLKIAEVSQKIVAAVKKTYSPDGYSIMQNGGEFNDIGHYHMHIFPRYKNDGFGWNESEHHYFNTKAVAEKIRENIE